MPPSNRLAKRRHQKSLPTKKVKKTFKIPKSIILVLLSILAIIAIIFLILYSSTSWDGKTKLSLVSQTNDGNVQVTIYDPSNSSIVTLNIPYDTQVEAANNLGVWKLGSISKLGTDKGLNSGNFLKNTIIKSFNYPVDDALSNRNSLFDKLKLKLFSLQAGDKNKFSIDLAKSYNLEKAKLSDGTLGYEIANNTPTEIKAYFVDNRISTNNLNLIINNKSQKTSLGKMVGETLGVLGLNISSIQNNGTDKDLDCKITGQAKEIVDKIAQIFACNKSYSKAADNFDIQVDLGSKFTSHW